MIRGMQFIGLSILLYILLLAGCRSLKNNEKTVKTPKEIRATIAEQNKGRLLRAIDRKYENPEAHFELGKLYQAEGLWPQAEQEYKTTLNFDPVHRPAQAARIKVLLGAGDKTKAKLLADEYIQRASNSALASLELGLGFQVEELDEYALSCYQQALRLAPNSAKINRQIGYYYLSKNDKNRALDFLSRSFNLNPIQPEVAHELGRLGVTVKIPQRKTRGTRMLDKTVDEYDETLK
ncbi:MAG: tetratricopeptide repeat protein [Planctomycetota bacterium]|jgi:tetratricopeptide (TPR) repeat protein